MGGMRLSTAAILRAVVVFFSVVLAAFAVHGAWVGQNAMREAEQSANAARILAALDKGTVEMSFERSLTQVGLALPGAFGPPFSDLLAEQRRKANEHLDRIEPMLDRLPDASGQAFREALDLHRETVEALRRDADAALAVDATARAAGVATSIPLALKQEVLLLRETGQMLAIPGGILPSEALALSSLVDAGWRAREFGGRERTYLAIAALTGKPIAPEAMAEARLNADIAFESRRKLERTLAIQGDALPANVRAAATRVLDTYFGSYDELRRRFLEEAAKPVPAYPMGFDDYFATSSAALDTTVQLTYAAGLASVAYWDERQAVARNAFIANLGVIAAILALAVFAWMLVERRIVKPIVQAQSAAERIAQLDLASPVPFRAGDELGALLQSLDRMRLDLRKRIDAEREIAAENSRVRNALDSSSAAMLILDAEDRVAYVNPSADRMIRIAEPHFRQQRPDFSAGRVVGMRIDEFVDLGSRSPSSTGQDGASASVRIKARDFDFELIANPVVDRGTHLGTAVEWVDRTSETRFRHSLRNIAQKAGSGILSARMEADADNPRLVETARIFNALMDATTQAIAEVQRTLSALAKGDLTVRSTARMLGSFAEMNGDANAASESLAAALRDVRDAVVAINRAAAGIASGNLDLSRRTEQAAASVEQTAAAMEQMTATLRQSTDHAQQAKQVATRASDIADQGGNTVERVVRVMREIEHSSRRMADITSAIDGIAFQTNILALNAAVEAARAGDQGRGFAVVAAEVRTLAQRSATAAKEIAQLISESAGRISEGAEVAEQAGRSMREIVGSSREVADIISEITAATIEQSKGVAEVNNAVVQMDQATQANSALVEEMTASAQAMRDQAEQLERVVSRFVLD